MLTLDPQRAPLPAHKEHELKIWPGYYAVVVAGLKRFEIRKDDRGFHAHDTLWLREWDHLDGYSGRSVRALVTYIVRGPEWGVPMGLVVMSIEVLPSVGEAGSTSVSPTNSERKA